MYRLVAELSADQRLAIESLLGRVLADDEGLAIHSSRIVKEAPIGPERAAAVHRLMNHLDMISGRGTASDADLDAAIDEAIDYVRHHPDE